MSGRPASNQTSLGRFVAPYGVSVRGGVLRAGEGLGARRPCTGRRGDAGGAGLRSRSKRAFRACLRPSRRRRCPGDNPIRRRAGSTGRATGAGTPGRARLDWHPSTDAASIRDCGGGKSAPAEGRTPQAERRDSGGASAQASSRAQDTPARPKYVGLRSALATQIEDPRIGELARRLIYFERPEMLPDAQSAELSAWMANRVLAHRGRRPIAPTDPRLVHGQRRDIWAPVDLSRLEGTGRNC